MKRPLRRAILVAASVSLLALFAAACRGPGGAVWNIGASQRMQTRARGAASPAALLARVDASVNAAITEKAFPGAAVAMGRSGVIAKLSGYGTFTYESDKPVTPDSPFDMASLTKVIATTTAAMLLYEEGRLDIDAPVSAYLSAFDRADKRAITLRHLLTHTSGLPPFLLFHIEGVTTREGVLEAIFDVALNARPGEIYSYSDFSMITMALVIESIAGQSFDTFAKERIFEPLGMASTGFRVAGEPDTSVVPTEVDDYFRFRLIQGEVHDETAWILGGAAGHAGLFSTARDMTRFAGMLTRQGRHEGAAFLQPETIRLFTTAVDTSQHSRALGWDTRNARKPSSSGAFFGPRSFGHTGFTGTSIWIDPDAELYVVLLTNRVYPTRENRSYEPMRPLVADLAYEALVGLPSRGR